MSAPAVLSALPGRLESGNLDLLLAALVKARADYMPVRRDQTNPAFRASYASLDAVLDAVTPALTANGLVIVHQTEPDDGGLMLTTKLMHTSGQWIGTRYPVRPLKPEPQALGSALTYARRYSVLAICAIAPEDDDGNAASAPPGRMTQRDAPPDAPRAAVVEDPARRALLNRIRMAGRAAGMTDEETLARWSASHPVPLPNAFKGELEGFLEELEHLAEEGDDDGADYADAPR